MIFLSRQCPKLTFRSYNKQYLHLNNIKTLNHPPEITDINLIKIIWDIVEKKSLKKKSQKLTINNMNIKKDTQNKQQPYYDRQPSNYYRYQNNQGFKRGYCNDAEKVISVLFKYIYKEIDKTIKIVDRQYFIMWKILFRATKDMKPILMQMKYSCKKLSNPGQAFYYSSTSLADLNTQHQEISVVFVI
ncbi:hypothetical protein ABPG72_020329 [Tetrahymena utriculariae]